jgi:hypothetical protein
VVPVLFGFPGSQNGAISEVSDTVPLEEAMRVPELEVGRVEPKV